MIKKVNSDCKRPYERSLVSLRCLNSLQRRSGESGYSLALALIAAFVLLIGVGALASRGNLGFIGQILQSQNRIAREAAEAAINEFAISINQERNRHLLIAGTTSNWDSTRWSTSGTDFRNVCTVFNDSFVPNLSSGAPVYVNPDPTFISRFTPGGGSQQLVQGSNARTFTVEKIEYLNQSRSTYVNSSGGFLSFGNNPSNPGSTVSYGDLYRSGGERSLIRITVRATVNQNGRTSTALVAREFEVVPKCCKRSFGRNIIGGTNWGRDEEQCGSLLAGKPPGLTVGTQEGAPLGSQNTKPIIQEDGSALTTAGCYSGPPQGQTANPLLGSPNSLCGGTSGTASISRGGISYNPVKLNYNPPTYNDTLGVAGAGPALSFSGSNPSVNIIYFDPESYRPATVTERAFSGVYLRRGNGTRTRLDGVNPVGATTNDPCYVVEQPGSGKPYYNINCKISGISVGSNKNLYIDTSAAKLNLFTTGNVNINGNGSMANFRDYRSDLSELPEKSEDVADPGDSQAAPTSSLVTWPTNPTNRAGTFLELCSDVAGYVCDKLDGDELYSVRRLLNFYSSDDVTFNLNGGAGGVGYNIYAPNGSVVFNGGGNNLNYMGQLFVQNFTPNGDVEIRTFGGGAGTVTGGTAPGIFAGKALIDFVARSFTQSSGFGL